MDSDPADARLVELLKESHRILVFTGAGISTASGIPDFRGPQGVWHHRKPVYLDEFLASDAARIAHWEYKLEQWPACRAARPNATHDAIVKLERRGRLLMCVTQNIDGLHQRAGTSADRLVEIHGTNTWVECLSCGQRSDPQPHFDFFRETRSPPRCDCGGWLKSATISFGQRLRQEDLDRAEQAAAGADLVVALGSSLSVYPASAIPQSAAERGVPCIVINRGETGFDGLPIVTLRLEGDVTTLFPPAVEAALGCA